MATAAGPPGIYLCPAPAQSEPVSVSKLKLILIDQYVYQQK